MTNLQSLQNLSLAQDKAQILWTPLNLGAALSFWVDANVGVTLNGSNASQWDDLSGNGRHLIQATAGLQLFYNTSDVKSLRSDGVDDFMQTSAFSLSQPFARFSVLTRTTAGIGSVINSISGTPNSPLATISSNQIQSFAGTAGLVSNQTFSIGQRSQFGEIFNNASSSIFNNAVVTNGTVGTNGLNGVRISGGTPLSTDFHSVLVMNRLPTTDERQRIEGYLAHRWGIQTSLPTGHPFFSQPPRIINT